MYCIKVINVKKNMNFSVFLKFCVVFLVTHWRNNPQILHIECLLPHYNKTLKKNSVQYALS